MSGVIDEVRIDPREATHKGKEQYEIPETKWMLAFRSGLRMCS